MFDEDSPSARCTSIMGSGFFGSAIVLLICCYAARSDKVAVHAQRAVVYVDGYSSNYEFGGGDGVGSGNVLRGPVNGRNVRIAGIVDSIRTFTIIPIHWGVVGSYNASFLSTISNDDTHAIACYVK